jgi:predicted alpha/beta hydrolase family esterase
LDLTADRIDEQMDDGDPRVLILPGWQGGSSDHWTGRWPLRHGHQLVQQHDWQRPLRGDWLMRLEETVLDLSGPVVLAAHGLGCHLAAAWAAYSPRANRVRGALLVAPPYILSEPWLSRLPSWQQVPRQRLPFPSTVVAQDQGGQSVIEHSGQWARDWGSRWLEQPPASDFLHGPDADWPQGHALLQELIKDKTWSPKNPKAWAAA